MKIKIAIKYYAKKTISENKRRYRYDTNFLKEQNSIYRTQDGLKKLNNMIT